MPHAQENGTPDRGLGQALKSRWSLKSRTGSSLAVCSPSFVGQWHLPACRKVCEQVADFLGGESFELAFGHHGDGRGFDLLDVLAGKDDPLIGGLDGPKPSSMPVKFVPWSKKTVRRSNRPSPSASSKIRIRSLPRGPPSQIG